MCLLFQKARPLCASIRCAERVDASRFLPLPATAAAAATAGAVGERGGWWQKFCQSFSQPLLVDRHFLRDLEQHMSIASLQTSGQSVPSPTGGDGGIRLATVEALRLALARRFADTPDGVVCPDLRELPVSLLRLYFSGREHCDAILARLPHDTFYRLFALAKSDGARYRPRAHHDAYGSDVYLCRRQALLHYVQRLLDLTFCSFERTLSTLLAECETWCDAGLWQAMHDGDDEYWQQMPAPASFRVLTAAADVHGWLARGGHLLWYAAAWRQHVTLLVERELRPWADDETRDWLLYRLQLYRDTQLDLQSVMVSSECFDDETLAANQSLATHYPACNRCCCADELPDLSPYALDNFKTGANLKERSTIHDQLGHYYIIKRGNNICKDRNDWDILRNYAERDPIIYDLDKYILRCVMLGNLPGARGFLSAVARIRINLSFWPEYADRVMSRAEIDATMHPYCHPYLVLAQRRAVKLAKERKKKRPANQTARTEEKRVAKAMAKWDRKENQKMAYDKTAYKMWRIKCRHFVSSLLKEMAAYVLESSSTLRQYHRLDFKWIQSLNITRIANGLCRAELSRQCARNGPAVRFDWSVIEYIEKSPDAKYDIKRGIVMTLHTAALRVTRKVLKRDFRGIIEVKATGIEEKIVLDRSAPLAPVYSTAAGDGKISLDDLHLLMFCMGTDQRQVMHSALFQPMGMSRDGLAMMREWLLDYYVYGVADDSYREKIREFERACPADHLKMKTAFRGINYYKWRHHVFYLPAPWVARQVDALRRRHLIVAPSEPTPAKLGTCYQCHGCQKFANGIVKPQRYPHHANHSELVYTRHQVYAPTLTALTAALDGQELADGLCGRCHLTLTYERQQPRYIEHHRRLYTDRLAEVEEAEVLDGQEWDPDSSATANTTSQQQQVQKKQKSVSLLNVAFYNIADGKPYCSKNRRSKVAGGVWSMDECRKNVIMRVPGTAIIVSCNRIPVVQHTADQTAEEEEEATNSKKKKQRQRKRQQSQKKRRATHSSVESGSSSSSGDDDDDDATEPLMSGEEEEGGDEEEEAEAAEEPGYETDILSLFTDIESVSKSNRESLELFARQRTQELTQNLQLKGKKAAAVVNGPGGGGGKRPTENNKKRIMRVAQEPLQVLYNCQVPMEEINMIGIVKDGKVLCVDCGVMTEYRNHNSTHYGPICMQHISSTMQTHHPAYRTDTATLQLLHQDRQRQLAKFRKNPPHPLALVTDGERRLCRACNLLPPDVRITVRNADYLLLAVECCSICHYNMRPLLSRHSMPPLSGVIQFAVTHKYQHSLHFT